MVSSRKLKGVTEKHFPLESLANKKHFYSPFFIRTYLKTCGPKKIAESAPANQGYKSGAVFANFWAFSF